VWALCDGQTSPAQMAEKLQAELNTPHAEELVWLTLARLEKAHLLQSEGVNPAGHKLVTRRELLVKLGVAAALLPVVHSIVAPGPVAAQSSNPSDIRLKTNVLLLSPVLERLKQVRGVTFEWNDIAETMGQLKGQQEIGVIAQEVEAVFPELVTTWGDTEYRAVDYSKLAAVLIEAVKELSSENEILTTRLNRTDTKLQQTQLELETLKAKFAEFEAVLQQQVI
jgi:hypothetical protein